MNRLVLTIIFYAIVSSAFAQPGNSLTAKDYDHAESFLGYNTQKFIDHGNVSPNWLDGDRFWYRTLTATGSEFILVDPSKGSRTAAFNQKKLAAALSLASGKNYSADMLPFQFFSYTPDGNSIIFRADGKEWKCDLQNYTCMADTSQVRGNGRRQGFGQGGFRGRGRGNEVLSPDGKKAAFIKDYNLWVKDIATGEKTQLTSDGVKRFWLRYRQCRLET